MYYEPKWPKCASVKMFNEICEKVKDETESLVIENKLLKGGNKELAKRMGVLEQYSRMDNVEIRSVYLF